MAKWQMKRQGDNKFEYDSVLYGSWFAFVDYPRNLIPLLKISGGHIGCDGTRYIDSDGNCSRKDVVLLKPVGVREGDTILFEEVG